MVIKLSDDVEYDALLHALITKNDMEALNLSALMTTQYLAKNMVDERVPASMVSSNDEELNPIWPGKRKTTHAEG